jgi:hypothetical protein
MRRVAIVLLMALSGSGAMLAQSECSPEQRQFDFWLGEWEVVDFESKTPVGQNTIRRIHGCTLEENWRGVYGDTGTSLNAYRSFDRRWHQVWVNDAGAFLHLEGEVQNGKMVLSGEAIRPRRGTVVLNRVTWSVVAEGVRQFWETSSDGGKTWYIDFDGLYRRKP